MSLPRRLPLALALLALAGVPGGARAQVQPGGTCVLEFYPRDPSRPPATNAVRSPATGNYNVYVGGGALYKCQGQDVSLTADSTEYIESAGVLYLIGNVHYREPRVRVDAARMTYFQGEDRLLAEGSVQAVTPSGTTMRGPRVEYFRAVPTRPLARMVATGRPETVLVQQDSSGRPQEPVNIVSDRIVTEADSLVYASGKVDITRTDLVARGDSAFLDSGREYARLMRSPSIESRPRRPTDRAFTLVGTTIDLFSRQRQLERVLALGAGKATSADLTLTADTIDLRVRETRMEHAYAWGPGRAHAVSTDREIVADSLDVYMPAQRLREVRALRNALARTDPDTTRIRSGERDWIGGDTLVARFDTAAPPRAPGDSARQPRIQEVVAIGGAQSYYQIASLDGGPTRPGVNYVRGRQITLHFAARPASAPGAPAGDAQGDPQQQLETVTVLDQAVGVYLEPKDDTTGARRASEGATPDAPRPGAPRVPVRAPGQSPTPSAKPAAPSPVRRPDA